MTLTLNLPRELEVELVSEAETQGLSPTEYVLFLLGERKQRKQPMPVNGAELVAYWEREGVIGMRSDITDSQAYARELRTNAEHRYKDTTR